MFLRYLKNTYFQLVEGLRFFSLGVWSLRIQVRPKEGITPRNLLWGWDWNPKSYSRNGLGFLWGVDVRSSFIANFDVWMFPKIGVAQNGWFIMENP